MRTSVGQIIRRQLLSYAEWADVSSGAALELARLFDLLTAHSLRVAGPPFQGLSFINASGLPFQWSACFGGGARSIRFLCEAGTPGHTSYQRYLESLELIRSCASTLGKADPKWIREIVVPILAPIEGEWPAHWRSALWFGAGCSGSHTVLKPYFNLNRGSSMERWQRVGRLLAELGFRDDLVRLCDLSTTVSPGSWPVGLALDVLSNGAPGRVKIYFRADPATEEWVARWYTAVHGDGISGLIRTLLDCFPYCDEKAYPPRSLITSLELYGDGRPATLKTDLAVTKWCTSDRDVVAGLKKLVAATTAIDAREVDNFLTALSIDVSKVATTAFRFVGLGLEPDGDAHVNAYVEPQLEVTPERVSSTRDKSNAALEGIAKGLEFLERSHHAAHWVDYALPVGESDAWVTAYTLLRLSVVPRPLISPETARKLDASLDWLESARRPNGSWGYNASCEADADSTALALLALRAYGRSSPEDALAFLASLVRADGGVATYLPNGGGNGSWEKSCADVSAVCFAALTPEYGEARERIGRYLDEQFAPNRPLGAFWWLSRLYPGVLALEFARDALSHASRSWLMRKLVSTVPVGAFECALRLLGLMKLGVREIADESIPGLIDLQNDDGSFPPSAWLRLTDQHVEDPWARLMSGRTFQDSHAILSTATAIAALSEVTHDRQRGRLREPPSPARSSIRDQYRAMIRTDFESMNQTPGSVS